MPAQTTACVQFVQVYITTIAEAAHSSEAYYGISGPSACWCLTKAFTLTDNSFADFSPAGLRLSRWSTPLENTLRCCQTPAARHQQPRIAILLVLPKDSKAIDVGGIKSHPWSSNHLSTGFSKSCLSWRWMHLTAGLLDI